MARGHVKDDAVHLFLRELSENLDLERAMKRTGVTKPQARELLKKAAAAFPGTVPSCTPSGGNGALLHLYTDGASRGNPGRAGAGVVIKNGQGITVKRLVKYLGVATNNVAEYEALLLALEKAREMGSPRIAIFADSELMVKQIRGEYGVKNRNLIPLYRKASTLLRGFEGYEINHIVRSKNSEADELANQAIDGAGG